MTPLHLAAAQEPPTSLPTHQTGPCAAVIFGATGDLTSRMLIPAFYNLQANGLLSDDFAIVGIATRQLTDEQFRAYLSERMDRFVPWKMEGKARDALLQRVFYVSGDFGDSALYGRVRARLAEVDQTNRTRGNYFFYLATSPSFFEGIIRQLGESKLAAESDGHWRRVVIEKPFGRDLDSARQLNRAIQQVLSEAQIYRIDHYLGKETVQNILAFRFGNGIFEPIWNRRYIDHVQITVSETVGVEARGGYFDQSGTLRDMVPNHLFQLLSLTTMEPPISFNANAVRDEQAKLLHAVQPISPEDVLYRSVRGQYGPGVVGGAPEPGYREEPSVPPQSNAETFVAMKLAIDNWRWADIPVYLRTGKRMTARHSEVAIQFKRAPFVLFRDTPVDQLKPNELVMHIAPDQGISLRFGAKIPGPQLRIGPVDMAFDYTDYFGTNPTTGYEVLLYDGMMGDQTLFQRADMVEAGWCVVNPILDVWKALPPRNFPNYAAGSWGPKEADDLIQRDGRHWRNDVV
ncbi:MAG TPA: glucose-6-phosphate dehydrogenase [Terriglobales bacterium]|nr:glucose-6-phosphate dehydrogenase [Terriglobales bacterium]